MKYRTLPNGDRISVLGFGLMRLPTGRGGEILAEKAKPIVDYALDSGVNIMDSAYTYGKTEHFAGQCILPGRAPHSVRTVGKLPIHRFHTCEGYNACLAEEIRRYGVDSIDYYLIHMANWDSFSRAVERGVLRFLDAALADGRIRHAGVSIHDSQENIVKIIDAYDRWSYIQLQYNLLDAPYVEEAMAYARGKGIGVFVMEPLRGGLLTNGLPAGMRKVIKEAPVRRSAAEWAFRFVYSNPAVTCVLSGMNEMAQVEENLRIADEAEEGCVTDEDRKVYDALREEYRKLQLIGCTGCNYCRDCPQMIDIPLAMRSLNEYAVFPEDDHVPFIYQQTVNLRIRANREDGSKRWAQTCLKCGQCERVCPQRLPIREHLARCAEIFEQDVRAQMDAYERLDADVVQDHVTRPGQED